MIGIARLELDSALQVQVDDLIKEGRKLSQAAGKGLSKEIVEGYKKRCDVISETVIQRKSVSVDISSNQG
jgi:hypothetical protein